ncbi:MAG: serine hydrolase [Phycisphaerae bacterium]|nr:serine hydrolase [Phycisphaerae bacterium]
MKASGVSGGGHGMDEKVLSQIPKKLKAIVDRGQSTGMVTLVARNGKIASIDAVGWRVINKEPLETTDVFWAASITKPFVAVAIMMLVDEGKLQLDDLVEKHIPEFKGQKVKTGKRRSETAKQPLTIRNLLNHLDGLPKNPARSRAAKTIKQRVLKAAKDTLMWEPGTKWRYGGEGLYVAAYLVEKYSGMPYAKFLKTRILDPLGMKNTYFTIKDVPENRAVPRHTRLKNGKWESSKLRDFTWSTGGNYFAVDGGFFSTVEDLLPWYQMLLNGGQYGGVRYLSEKSVYELTHKQTGDVKNAGHGAGNFHALAFQEAVQPQGETAALTKGSFGKGGSGGSITWVDPSTKTIYIMLQNVKGVDRALASSTFLNAAAAAIGTKKHPPGDAPSPSVDVIEAAGVKGGLVVHIGCRDGKFTAALHASDSYIVQGLATDSDAVMAARESLVQSGDVTIAMFDGKTLPYADNLVQLVVADSNSKVAATEIMRVLSPGGVVMTRTGGGWKREVKPWPDDIDEWSHHMHGPDNNPVAKDTVVGPPRRLRWKAPPPWSRSHEHVSSFAVMVSASGRNFYIFDESVPGVIRYKPAADAPEDKDKAWITRQDRSYRALQGNSVIPEKWTLFARDAFSGVLLWKRPLKDWDFRHTRTLKLRYTSSSVQRALVAGGDHLFTTDRYRGSATVLDASSGKVLRTIKGTDGTDEIIFADGTLYLRVRGDAFTGIVAADPEKGKILWKHKEKEYNPLSLAVSGEHLVYNNRKQFICLSSKDGKDLWKKDSPKAKGFKYGSGPTVIIADNRVVVGSSSGVLALNKQTGETEWTRKISPKGALKDVDTFVIDGVVWHSNGAMIDGYDLDAGKLVRQINPEAVFSDGHHGRCYGSKATSKYIIGQHRGVEFLHLKDESQHHQNDWTRGPCRFGVMPCNGLLYVPQHQCLCYPGSLMNGFNAYASASKKEMAGIVEAAKKLDGRLHKGPAYGKAQAKAPAPGDWPMYRRNPQRFGATTAKVTGKLKQSWRIDIGGQLTPPVMAGGTVFVSAKDRDTLYALNAADGKEKWHYRAGGQIDSPPSILGDLVLFGSADGWLYCLRAGDGRLVWRFHAAPTSEMIVVDNRVESPWKVHGSPLILDGKVYFSAGRSTFVDGGIFLYALDPTTGKVLHRGRIDTWSRTRTDADGKPFLPAFHIEGTRSDLLVSEGGALYMGQIKLSPSLEVAKPQYRPGPDPDSPDVRGPFDFKTNPTYYFFGKKDFGSYPGYPNKGRRKKLNGHMGARKPGRHLITTGGFLDGTYWHRIFWMYGETWPGFNHANVASKSGQLLVIGPKKTYAVQCYPERTVNSPQFIPGKYGYLLFADNNDNEPVLDDKDWGRDKGIGFTRNKAPVWHQWAPLRIRAMTLAGKQLFVAGPPDKVDPKDPLATFENRGAAMLWVYDSESGKRKAEYDLKTIPVFDGMIAGPNRIVMSMSDGSVVCMTPE